MQEAELDPTMVVEDELFAIEAWEPCLICGAAGDMDEVMYCDGCEKAVHVFCAGFGDAPEVWYCETCLVDLESNGSVLGTASRPRTRQRRTRVPATQRRARRNGDADWARVWQEVSRRLDLDLDFPFDEEEEEQRTDEQRRDIARWQRRLRVADQQGAVNRLRGIANAHLQRTDPAVRPNPESQEELRAWNAFDKARESQEAPVSIRRSRKRKATASPAPSQEAERTEHPVQKRPRLRKPPNLTSELQQDGPESSNAAAERTGPGPTFLSSLLREVETKPISATSPGASENQNGHYSPRESSPAASQSSSECASPRIMSVTPPPQRPLSPPLSSTIIPLSSPINGNFSPFSPADITRDQKSIPDRGRRRQHSADSHQDSNEDVARDRASSASPSRALSYSAKQEVQRMVKIALGTRYRDKEISKDQYTDVNRDVSRRLYELVGDASALSDQAERERWQGVADEEVQKAVAALSVANSAHD